MTQKKTVTADTVNELGNGRTYLQFTLDNGMELVLTQGMLRANKKWDTLNMLLKMEEEIKAAPDSELTKALMAPMTCAVALCVGKGGSDTVEFNGITLDIGEVREREQAEQADRRNSGGFTKPANRAVVS